MDKKEHDKLVQKFFRKCQQDNPGKFREVMDKYPVITWKRMQTIREREVSLALLEERE